MVSTNQMQYCFNIMYRLQVLIITHGQEEVNMIALSKNVYDAKIPVSAFMI